MLTLAELDAAWKRIDPMGWIDVCSDQCWRVVLQGSIILHPHKRVHLGDTLAEAIEGATLVVSTFQQEEQ